MNKTRTPNANPAVEAIMQAYLKTHMTEKQFEELIVQSLDEAKQSQITGAMMRSYDEGFSDGYDSCEAEYGIGKHQEPGVGVDGN